MRLALVVFVGVLATVRAEDDSRSEDLEDSSEIEPYSPPDPALEEYIICRQCGGDIADSYYVYNRHSPFSTIQSNLTLFGKKGVDVQTLTNPLGIKFKIINTSKTYCVGVGDWVPAHSWYPGYVWKFCVCPHCSAHLGWIFEPADSAESEESSLDKFYGIVVDKVLGERSDPMTGTMEDLLNDGDTPNDAQKEFIKQLEEQFCDRFTEKDEDFMKVFNGPVLPPPIMDPWDRSHRRFNRKRNRNDYDSRNNYGKHPRYDDRRDDYGRDRYNDRDRRDNYNNDRDNYYHKRRNYYR